MKKKLPSRVLHRLQKEGSRLRSLLPPASNLLIGVSGGPDSMALLHILKEIYPHKSLVVGYLHHGCREEADAEAQFVKETAVILQIPCHIEKIDVIGLSRNAGLSLEEAGRKARYDFFARLARQVGAKTIAVGHHADDQAETVLMHLLRGSGLAGLRGMLPVSQLPDAPDLMLLRPFLTTTRAEIEQYCQENNIPFVTDATNQDPAFFRNRLRHELLPLLADYSPQIKTRLQRMAAIMAADYDLLAELTHLKWAEIVHESGAGWVAMDRSKWLALPLSLRQSTLRHAVWQMRDNLRDVGFKPIEQARLIAENGEIGSQSMLPDGLVLTVDYALLTIVDDPDAMPVHWPQMTGDTAVPLPIPGRVLLNNGWMLEAESILEMNWAQIKNNPDPWTVFVDVAGTDLIVRGREPGERIRPLGMSGQSAKIKDVMINRKIPARMRSRWPIVSTATHPVWLAGHVIDERGKVTAVSPTIIRLHCQKIG